MKVIILNQVYEDLGEIFNYISQNSIRYAIKTIDEILIKTKSIGYMPYIGQKIPELNNGSIRKRTYKSYKIIYEIKKDVILIHTVWHGARDIKNLKIN
jgi:plasmid stabilization system protein ParE